MDSLTKNEFKNEKEEEEEEKKSHSYISPFGASSIKGRGLAQGFLILWLTLFVRLKKDVFRGLV